MPQIEFPDAELVLVAHGSTTHADSALAARRHAAALRGRGLFLGVREAFYLQEPKLAAVLAAVKAPRVFVVPLFLSEGYFTGQVIPLELGLRPEGEKEFDRVRRRGAQRLIYCRPIGNHPRMTDVILARAAEAGREGDSSPDPARAALLIAAHGTGRDERSRLAALHHAARIREREIYAEVHAVFMEDEPRVKDWTQLTAARDVVVVPFFVSEGQHPREDIPVLLGEEAAVVQGRLQRGAPTWVNPTMLQGRRVWYSASIGTEPLVADVVIERVREMSGC